MLYRFIVAQSDMALSNGTRFSTDYPDVCSTPNSTVWWRTSELPGQERNFTVSLYETSYDRSRVVSAAAHLMYSVRNFEVKRDYGIASYYAFDDDGLFVGILGCRSYRHPVMAQWKSSEANGAGNIRPDLCPFGRYGFDPRCRDWYDSGKRKAYDTKIPFYVTAPYFFATDVGYVAQSAVAFLVDKSNGYFVGESLFDFEIGRILDAFTPVNTPLQEGGFPLLVTPTVDNFGGDVVIGPGFDGSNSSAKPVASIVVPTDIACAEAGDSDCETRKQEFSKIAASMKACETGTQSFVRRSASGREERYYISYAPVKTVFMDPVNSADFASGALRTDSCVYSLALVEKEDGIKRPFSDVEEDLEEQTRVAIGILAGMIFFALAFAIIVSYYVARSITEPMRYLLDVIRSVENMGGVDHELPDVERSRGSKEIANVSTTMETLFEVVRFANVAFYAGELEVAFRVLRDSLRIFRGMDNKKAISVASNNLGNILLVMFLDMKNQNVDSKYCLTRQEIIAHGLAYFHEAITLGEAAYEAFYEKEGTPFDCFV